MVDCFKCKEEKCEEIAVCKGLCKMHYNSKYRELQKDSLCSVIGCTRNPRCRGLCYKHYKKSISGDSKKKKDTKKCSFENCTSEKIFNKQNNLCLKHYFSYKRNSKRGSQSTKDIQQKLLPVDYRSFIIT
jgi:serine phosphatase RsbU (regulator of sigma subunit)